MTRSEDMDPISQRHGVLNIFGHRADSADDKVVDSLAVLTPPVSLTVCLSPYFTTFAVLKLIFPLWNITLRPIFFYFIQISS